MIGPVIESAQVLASHLHDESWVILDARFDINDESRAKHDFLEGHIPGAQQADLGDHMAGQIVPGKTGRRPLPNPEQFAVQIGSWGIDNDTRVVIYDAMNGIMAASRLWFMLRWAGHDNVSLLDGGYQAWLDGGYSVSTGARQQRCGSFQPCFRNELVCSLDDVDRFRTDGGYRVFDARSLSDGIPSHDPVRGRIAGSRAADRALNSTSDGHWRSSNELRNHYGALTEGVDANHVVFYCGSGVTAAQNVVGMEHAGLAGARLYVGSFSEWILDPSRPVSEE